MRDILNSSVGEDAQRYSREAMGWLMARSKKRTPFSFRWVCHWLDLDAEVVLALILEMKERGEKLPP